MALHIIDEAKRCLQCRNAHCNMGCPINTRIPKMIEYLLNGELDRAGEMLFENNPLSLVCSLICNHENQCEGNCVLAKRDTSIGSVHISDIEHYVSEHYFDTLKIDCKPDPERMVAIVGSGPAGLTIAIMLAKWGYSVTVFEANDQIGGVLRYGIPEFRLPKSILDRYKKVMDSMGIKYRPNILIGQGGLVIDDLFRDGYKAIFIGTGVWKPNAIGIKGESLGHVHFAINYLKNPNVYNLGEKVIVIGAGNSAMDVARTVIRKGSTQITSFFLMGEEQLTASKGEVEYAMIEGMKMEYFKKPVEIVHEGVIFVDTKVIIDKETNEYTYEEIPDTEKLYPADSVIIAISQGPRSNIVSSTAGIEITDRGLLKVDEQGVTTREGVFASGDVVSGAKTVVEAVKYSKDVARNIANYVESKIAEQA